MDTMCKETGEDAITPEVIETTRKHVAPGTLDRKGFGVAIESLGDKFIVFARLESCPKGDIRTCLL
ncbi:hypothetical protein EB235_09265 [Mesorhizobium loti R88b]|uniref:Uncharacterized protein n=1 Tax=Mesorhizobium loti R88b TaxID=935548 RepID=A0A6M7WRK2_RHILI|nr:hypothetical protein EB235_09265 [Mesorhizobium loti R88b]